MVLILSINLQLYDDYLLENATGYFQSGFSNVPANFGLVCSGAFISLNITVINCRRYQGHP